MEVGMDVSESGSLTASCIRPKKYPYMTCNFVNYKIGPTTNTLVAPTTQKSPPPSHRPRVWLLALVAGGHVHPLPRFVGLSTAVRRAMREQGEGAEAKT